MRTVRSLAPSALLVLLLTGCQLHASSSNCTSDPGVVTGGSQVCTQAPPTQFNQLGGQ